MSFLIKGDVGPNNIPEGEVPKNMGSRGLFGSLAQAVMQAAEGNNSGMGLQPTGRRRSKFRMAGKDFAPILFGSKTPILFGIKKRGSGAEAVNYSPRTREKDEMESRLRRKAEERSRRRRKRKGKKDLSEYDFTPQRPKYGKELIPSKPIRMTKEEYDRMPKRARRKFELAPGMEDLIDRFPTQGDEGKPRKSRRRTSRDEMRDPNARPTVRSENIL